jgi:hypothetical protein
VLIYGPIEIRCKQTGPIHILTQEKRKKKKEKKKKRKNEKRKQVRNVVEATKRVKSKPGLEKMLPVEIHVRATVEHRHHAVQIRRAGAEGD